MKDDKELTLFFCPEGFPLGESFEGWLVQLTQSMMQRTLNTALVAWLNNLKLKAEQNL